ncbi:MAG: hypothetical protein HGB05_07630, partial [Chloroflexi bacterium]|nr:hypothetical protein [Chloroflexota bacterium]
LKQELNKFAISRTSYTPYDGMPYVPGTSLKGALRTAYLNMCAAKPANSGNRDNGLN